MKIRLPNRADEPLPSVASIVSFKRAEAQDIESTLRTINMSLRNS